MLTALIVALVIGAIAGWLAGLLVQGTGFGLLGDIIVGIVGAMITSMLFPKLGIGLTLGGGNWLGAILAAAIGARHLAFDREARQSTDGVTATALNALRKLAAGAVAPFNRANKVPPISDGRVLGSLRRNGHVRPGEFHDLSVAAAPKASAATGSSWSIAFVSPPPPPEAGPCIHPPLARSSGVGWEGPPGTPLSGLWFEQVFWAHHAAPLGAVAHLQLQGSASSPERTATPRAGVPARLEARRRGDPARELRWIV